jgi:aspartate/glutamate racemase
MKLLNYIAMKSHSTKTLGIIHAALISSKAVQPFIDEIIPEVTVVHVVDDTIQRSNFACLPGEIPKANFFRFVTYAHLLEEAGVDLILLACSTFNRAVELARPMIDTPLLQIDRPMMDRAVQQGRRIGLLATVPTTVPSSERLLLAAAQENGKGVEVVTRLCSEAFQELQQGNVARHNQMLLEEIDRLSGQVDAIVMAQVSMSALEPMLGNTKVPVYNSGRTGFEKVRELLGL